MAYPPFAYMEPAIAQGESGGDWNALYNFQNRAGGLFGDVNVSDMTINEVLDFQRTGSPYATYVTEILGYKSTPVGRYQIVGDTLEWAKGKLGLTGEEKFDPATQRQIAEYIYNTQGPSAWEALKGTQMADQMIPQPMAPQQAAGYQPFSTENLPRNQRILLGLSALQDAAASLRGKQTSFFSEALGGLEQQHRYGQELAFRQGQEQRLIDESMAAQRQSATTSQMQAATALAGIRQQLQWSPNDPILLALEQSLMAQALGSSGAMPSGAMPDGGEAPTVGKSPAVDKSPASAMPVAESGAMIPTDPLGAFVISNNPNATMEQVDAAIQVLSPINDDRAQEAVKRLANRAASLSNMAAAAGVDLISTPAKLQTVYDLMQIIEKAGATGWGAKLFSSVPNTVAKEAAGLVQSLKANLGFDKLQQMRLAAASGASGLGQVTERELGFLQSAIASIDLEKDKDATLRDLKKIEEHYFNTIAALRDDLARNGIHQYDDMISSILSGRQGGLSGAGGTAGLSQEALEFFNATPQGQ